MEKPPDQDLETFIHQELRRLPLVEAPGSLIANVQATVQRQQSLPWWQRSWFSWPRPWRLASVGAFLILAVVLCLVPWWMESWMPPAEAAAGPWLTQLGNLWSFLVSVGSAAALLARWLADSPWLWLAAAVTTLAYISCIAAGTLFVRVAGARWPREGAV